VKADVLVNLLLELNVLNVQDIDRELKKLAAYVEDPRAQKWLMRVARNFIINIDQLLKQPYRAKAEPRGHFGSKYRYEPTGGFDPKQAPAEPSSETRIKWWGEQPMAGDPNACHTCGGSGYVQTIKHTETGEEVQAPWTTRDPEEERKRCPDCKGTGKRKYQKPSGGEGFFPESKTLIEAGRKRAAAMSPEEPIEPDPAGVYTSTLHEPAIQRHIDQNFRPYRTKTAPKKELFGGPPPASKVEPWVKERETEQELHHFDPIQVRRRELWINLENLVNYFNWKSSVLAKRDSEKPEEQNRARSAELFFRQLETMPTADLEGFRDIMRQGQDYAYDVENRPWLYMTDPKLVSEYRGLKLIRATLWQTVYHLSRRKTAKDDEPTWCTNTEHHAKSYSSQGPLYFVDKNGYPYVLLHFETTQAKGLNDAEIEAPVAKEIAPLFADPQRFPLEKFGETERRFGGGGLALLKAAVKAYRQKAGIQG
jgi:hypothetical protein